MLCVPCTWSESKEAITHTEVTKVGMFDIQVCVPKEFDDSQVGEFAEKEYPCGTEHGWQIRRKGDKALKGDPERNQCAKHKGNVHIMLDA